MIGHKRKYDFYRRIIAFQEKRGWNDVCGVVSNCVFPATLQAARALAFYSIYIYAQLCL